jgi:hypothetical protein
MCQPNENSSIDEEVTKLFFDFDAASSGTSWIPMTGLDATSDQGMRHRPGSIDPAISLLSSSTIFECSGTIEGSEGFNSAYSTSSAPMPVPAPSNRHYHDTKKVTHRELGVTQLASQMESEVAPLYEFIALREIEGLQTDISPNSFGAFQESVHMDQIDVSLKQANPLPFGSHIMDTQTPVAANPAVMNIATHMALRPEPERPKDMTFGHGKRKRTPPPGGFMILDLLGCSPWPGQCRTEQEQTERDEVVRAGGSCLLCTFRHKKVRKVILEINYTFLATNILYKVLGKTTL